MPRRPKTTDPLERARARALRWLATSPRSRAELHDRLARAGFADALIAPLLDDFTRAGLINDAALAERLIERETERLPAGRARLEHHAAARGIDPALAAQAIDRHAPASAEHAAAREAARAKLTSIPPTLDPAKAAGRLLAFLVRRGFDPETAADAARHALHPRGQWPDHDP